MPHPLANPQHTKPNLCEPNLIRAKHNRSQRYPTTPRLPMPFGHTKPVFTTPPPNRTAEVPASPSRAHWPCHAVPRNAAQKRAPPVLSKPVGPTMLFQCLPLLTITLNAVAPPISRTVPCRTAPLLAQPSACLCEPIFKFFPLSNCSA